MAKKEKITRKELLGEPDEFLSFSRKLFLFLMEYKIHFIGAVAVFLVIILSISGFRFFISRAENKAYSSLYQSKGKYDAIRKEKGPQEAYRELEKEFTQVIEKYGRYDGGRVARAFFADMCVRAGDYDRAISLYTQAIEDFKNDLAIKNLLVRNLAHAYEMKKDIASAITYFEKTAADPEGLMKDEVWFTIGRLYSQTGDKTRGLDAFNKITSEFPESPYVGLIQEKRSG